VDSFNHTHEYWQKKDPKFVYYLSAEFLMGRTMTNAIYNLGLEGEYADAVRALGTDLETVTSAEVDAALGNGGLGRLASCFLDSMASLDLPGWGYGIRYRYGMFKQGIAADGKQMELPDKWIPETGNPWEIRRSAIRFPVGFYGSVTNGTWTPAETVEAVACDVPIPGYRTTTTSNLRLWDCEPMEEFDLEAFNAGEYDKAVLNKRKADEIVAILYPNDATEEGKELRLKQQYFFVAASLQDTLARFLETHSDLEKLPEKACFQMNDTHPTIAVPELMRLLIDVHGLEFNKAWEITKKSLAYTNHTVMPEALEKWPVAVLEKLLPRHMQLIEQINATWLASIQGHVEKKVAVAAPADPADVPTEDSAEDDVDSVAEALKEYSIVQENPWNKGEMLVNMAYLAVVGSFAVNGVAAIHSEIIKEDIFPQFVEIFPEKFQNKTNGVTLRRWLAYCNPELASLITEALGTDEWIRDATLLAKLKPMAEDAAFRKKWMAVKLKRKEKLAAHIKASTGYDVPVKSMFDVQVKRIHEYKRQLMNAISLVHRYQNIKAASPEERAKMIPRVAIMGGKAASAYYMAKKIVALINAVSNTVNNDPEVGDLLKVIFLPNYNVTEAEVIIPAAELSQHISTAGTEASGTSNMKFALNGSTIIGTMDGANIEIAENTGIENLFTFGVDAADISRLREERKDFKDYDPRWNAAFDAIRKGEFGDAEYFEDLVDSVNVMNERNNDWFLVANDFATYMDAQDEADALYADQEEWTKRSIIYTASNGFFSSDRTISQYANEIWNVKPVKPN
jgi:starch phosphorylase